MRWQNHVIAAAEIISLLFVCCWCERVCAENLPLRCACAKGKLRVNSVANSPDFTWRSRLKTTLRERGSLQPLWRMSSGRLEFSACLKKHLFIMLVYRLTVACRVYVVKQGKTSLSWLQGLRQLAFPCPVGLWESLEVEAKAWLWSCTSQQPLLCSVHLLSDWWCTLISIRAPASSTPPVLPSFSWEIELCWNALCLFSLALEWAL